MQTYIYVNEYIHVYMYSHMKAFILCIYLYIYTHVCVMYIVYKAYICIYVCVFVIVYSELSKHSKIHCSFDSILSNARTLIIVKYGRKV